MINPRDKVTIQLVETITDVREELYIVQRKLAMVALKEWKMKRKDGQLPIIKRVRELVGCGLKEGKDFVDEYYEKRGRIKIL